MFSKEIEIRVRYGETDKMGYVYYGVYPMYYEVARTEAIRSIGYSYKELEDEGVMMPVVKLTSEYVGPAFYDDLLTVKVTIPELPKVRAKFLYEIFNQNGKLVNKGETDLVFVDEKTRKPQRIPEKFFDLIKKMYI